MGFVRSAPIRPEELKFAEKRVGGKVYEHDSLGDIGFPEEETLGAYLGFVLKESSFLSYHSECPDFFVATVWNNEGQRAVDLAAYHLDEPKKWRSNAGDRNWIYQQGIWRRPEGKEEDTCEEGIVVLGEEVKLRRRTGSLEEWLDKKVGLEFLKGLLGFKH
jgi:hypothetical protein